MPRETIASLKEQIEKLKTEQESSADVMRQELTNCKQSLAAKEQLLNELQGKIGKKDAAIAELNAQLEAAAGHELDNMRIWSQVCETPESALEVIKGGPLKGKHSIDPMYRFQKLTEVFGPAGIGWGFDIVEVFDREFSGEPFVYVRGFMWYVDNRRRRETPHQIGGTNASYGSDEAYKMAITDAATKCASLIGLAADVFLGQHDDKYKNAAAQSEPKGKGKGKQRKQQKQQKRKGKLDTSETAALIENASKCKTREELLPFWNEFKGYREHKMIVPGEADMIEKIFARLTAQIDKNSEGSDANS